MADANVAMQELNKVVLSDTDEGQESFSLHQEEASDKIPLSLLSYFEASKSRAAVCQKLILEDLEDLSGSPQTEDMMDFPAPDVDLVTLNELVISDTENGDSDISTDGCLVPGPTETEALFTHKASACPDNQDEAGTMKAETLESAMNEKERKQSAGYEVDRAKRLSEEEQTTLRERDFQEELRRLAEAEKLQQVELELMAKVAQEKLEQELLLQQELISNLRRRVEEERKMRNEEQKKIKEEQERKKKKEEEKRKKEDEEKRKREEEKMKRKNLEEETRRKKEDEEKRKREEMRNNEEKERRKMEEEERRKKDEEEKRKKEIEENRKREEKREQLEKKKQEVLKRSQEEEERKNKVEIEKIKKEEEERKNKVEIEKIKKEERKKVEVEGRNLDEEKKRKMEEVSLRKEEWKKNEEEERKQREEEDIRVDKEMRLTKEAEETRKKKYEEERNPKKTEVEVNMISKEIIKRDENKHGRKDESIKPKAEEKKKKEEEEQKGKEWNKEEMEEEVRKKDRENKKLEEAERSKEGDQDYRNIREERKERKLKEEREGNKRSDASCRKVENERKIQDDITKKQIQEEEGENREETHVKTEKRSPRVVEEDSTEITVKGKETNESQRRIKELQDKIKETEKNLILRLEGHIAQTSSSCRASPSVPQTTREVVQHDLNISQTSIYKTVDEENPTVRPSTAPSGSVTLCLLEHTEQKRLAWMKDCVPWSKLSLQNKRKQNGSGPSGRKPRRAAEPGILPPLPPDALLQDTGWKSLKEVTTVTLEDLPGCSFSTLAQCPRLQSLTLRRCGLKALEGINQLPELCYVDVQENEISFVDCENMSSLRVLRLSHNKLTSIHGLRGAENLDVLDLSHNSISRIAGLESTRRLQRLSVDHNQLISTKGLRDLYTLLHLDCSHNHLAGVEGLENSVLLSTLDLRANSLSEPPRLNNHVLLTELRLDDNSISSLQGLAACWLPLLQHLSVAQNRITQLPCMSDFMSLENLDLQFNCLSELNNACESLQRCRSLTEVHLTGNPLQREHGWRSTLLKAVSGLRAIDGQETDSFLSPPAVQPVSLASGSFLTLCQAQLQQIHDLQQQHSRELSNASSSLEAVKTSCRHLTEVLQLAEEHRFAHEYGDTSVCDTHEAAVQTVQHGSAKKPTELPHVESSEKISPLDCWTPEKSACHSLETKGKTFSSHLEVTPASHHQDLHLKNVAAVVIQQWWRKRRQKCGNMYIPPTAEKGGVKGGGGREPASGPLSVDGRVDGQDYAATVIQASWRGFTLRRRLASALAAVTCPDTGDDDTFEEVDVDEFVFDEAALEKDWPLPLSEDSASRKYPESEQPLSVKPRDPFPGPSQYMLPPPMEWRPKQAWVAREQVERVSPESNNSDFRGKSPASALSGLSERSGRILEEWGFTDSHTALLMLKRAQKMKSKKQRQKKLQVREAELDLEQTEKAARVKERAQQRLRTRADSHTESEHFLPEISSDVLNGGRVQLVADPGYTKRLHHASSSFAAQPCAGNNYPRRNSLGHARKEVPSPKRVTSAPNKRERISFRDNPVQLSGGWGGGKKRGK